MKRITEDIIYIGVNDHKVDLFEGQYDVPNGMAYNSYVVMDEKVTVFDTVDQNFGDEWLSNLGQALGDRKPDYLVVLHMEPDHSANIAAFAQAYPEAVIVGNAKTFVYMKQFFGTDFADRRLVVKDQETLETGSHTFTFVFASLVHWPEVMFAYDSKEKTLFSADAFGKFGALDVEEDWACEARRYYFGIVGKYGAMVQKVLAKAKTLDIERICPLHGPILDENLGYYLDLYNTWSSYGVETEGTAIFYASIYGHTKEAAELLKEELEAAGCPKVVLADLAREDMAECVEDAFRYGKIVLASVTYNGTVFPWMRDFLAELTERGYQNRKIGIIENGTWAPAAAKVIKAAFEKSRNITFADTVVSIRSAMTDANRDQVKALAQEMK
ncbi:MAG: FprA family A-type flavoprotein [Eubacterium sp.]|nr:FprA family A-type flavoprotein [Eubacterium sp.]